MLPWDILFAGGVYFALLIRPLHDGWNVTAACMLPLALVLLRPLVLSHVVALVALGFCFALRDPTYLFLPVLVFGVGCGSAASADRRRAVILFTLAFILASFVLLPVPAQQNAVSALRSLFGEASAVSNLFGWHAPDFQSSPEIAAALVFLILGAYLTSPVLPERLALYLSVFLLLVLSHRSAIYLNLGAALIAYELVHRRLQKRAPLLVNERTLLMTLFLCAVPCLFIDRTSRPLENEVGQLLPVIQEYTAALSSTGSQLHLLHRPELGTVLSKGGLPIFAAAAPLGAESAVRLPFRPSRIDDAAQLFSLAADWPERLRSDQVNAVLLERREPLAGALIEALHWKVIGESSDIPYVERSLPKITKLVFLVPEQ